MQGESQQAILTAKHLQLCQKPCTFIWLYVRCLVWLASTLFKLGNRCYHIIASTECLWNTSLISQFISHVLMLNHPSPSFPLYPTFTSHSSFLTLTFFLFMQINGFNFALSVVLFSTTVSPSQPRIVSIQSMDIGPTFARVHWQPPSSRGIPTVSRYVIIVTQVNGSADPLTFNTADATRDLNVTGLAPGTRYEFRVVAISESEMVVGQSFPSDPFSATTNLTGIMNLCGCVCVWGG